MGFQLKKNEYYQIRQIIEDKQVAQFKLYFVDEESITKFTRILAGIIIVYIYNDKTNKRIDMTSSLGRINTNIDEFKKIYNCTLQYQFKYEKTWINAYLYEDRGREALGNMPNSNGSMYYVQKYPIEKLIYWKLKTIEFKNKLFEENINKENINKESIKEKVGKEYEIFIGKKYEELGKKVIYNGINKGKKDNGIDLIIDEEKNITFVQCKNWINNEYYKLNQKDIRAFIGDCYIYILNNNINKKNNFHFIVSDENLLTKSANIYIKENKKVKFKVIPFE